MTALIKINLRFFFLAIGVLSTLSFGAGQRPEKAQNENLKSSLFLRLDAETVFSLNKDSGFHNIRRIDADDSGRVYVLDENLGKVFVFDHRGRLIREIGRKGPGEQDFELPSGLSLDRQDHIVVSDEIKKTLFYFTKEGVYLRKVSTNALCLYRISILDNDRIAAMTSPRYGGPFRFELKILDSKLEEVATLGSVLSPQQGNTYDPFWIGMPWAVGKNEMIYYSHPVKYDIEVFDCAGKRVQDIVKDVAPIEITDAEKEEAAKGFIPQGYKWAFSKYRAAFQDFTIDEQGRLFVRTWAKDPKTFGFLFDVFDTEGRLIASFPLFVKPELWKNGKLYTIEGDERGAQVVKSYAVTWEKNRGLDK